MVNYHDQREIQLDLDWYHSNKKIVLKLQHILAGSALLRTFLKQKYHCVRVPNAKKNFSIFLKDEFSGWLTQANG